MTTKKAAAKKELFKDVIILIIGALLAISLSKSGALEAATDFIGIKALASFFAGLFFTSMFTVAPASVVLANIATDYDPIYVALWGALGAMFGDLVIFFFIKERFSKDVSRVFNPRWMKVVMKSFHLGFMKWLVPIIGGLLIALPIPDEIGVTVLGFSRVKLITIVPIAYVFNFFGILAIVWIGHLLTS